MKLILALILVSFTTISAHAATISVIDDRGQVTSAEGRLVATDANFDIYTSKDETNFCQSSTPLHMHVLFIVVKHPTGTIKQVQLTIITQAVSTSGAGVMTTGLWFANPGQLPARQLLDGTTHPITNQPLFGTDIPLSQVLTGLCK